MKKILCIDGGGIRGLIPALVLSSIEDNTQKRIASMFDLIAGTSSGGMIALGLSVPGDDGIPAYSAKDIAKIYKKMGHEIFRNTFWRSMISMFGLAEVKYRYQPLEETLKKFLGETELGSSVTKLLVSSYDIENQRTFFFKSWNEKHKSVKMRDIARATTAAPSYFEPAQVSINGKVHTLIDGGVFANNPALSAYSEAKRLFPEEEMLIVSLGAGKHSSPISYVESRNWGIVEWAVPLFNIVFDSVSDSVDYYLRYIMGEYYFRFQTVVDVKHKHIDKVPRTDEEIESLKDEARKMLRDRKEDLDKVCSLLI